MWEACVGFTIACLGVFLLGMTIKQNRQTEKQIEKRVDKAYAEYIFRHSDKKTAGGAVRIIMDLAGISDVTSKSLGSNTPINVIRATMDGLSKLKTREDVLKLRESAKSLED